MTPSGFDFDPAPSPDEFVTDVADRVSSKRKQVRSDGTPAKLLDQFDEPVQKMTAGQAGCVGLMVLPLVLAVGTMRWNITATLDADLAKVLTWFCDTVSMFRLLTPLAYVKTENKLIQSFWRSASTKVVLLAYAFQVLKIVGLIVGALIAFHYLLSMLFAWMFGK